MLTPRLEKIRQRYSDDALLSLRGIPKDFTADDVFGALASTDPTQGHKYVGWLIEKLSSFKYEDISGGKDSTVGTTLADFDRLKKTLPEKDRSLMRHKSLGDLWRAIKPALEAEKLAGETIGSREAKRRVALKAGMESVIQNNTSGLTTIFPLTREASKFWGQQTRWCTAAEKMNLFSMYANAGPLIIFITPDKKKYQFHANLDKLSSVMDWDTPSTMFTECAFLNDADEPLTSEDYKSLRSHRDEILAAIESTPLARIELPATWTNGKRSGEAVLDGFLEMAKDTPLMEKPQSDDASSKKPLEPPKKAMTPVNPITISQETLSEHVVNFKDVASSVSIVDVETFHNLDAYGTVKDEKVGVVIPYDNIPSAIQVLREIEMQGLGSPDIILLPEPGQDDVEFYSALCKTILSDSSNMKKEWSKECFRHSFQQYPEILSQLVVDNIISLEEKEKPRYAEVHRAMMMRNHHVVVELFGNFSISEDKIGEMTRMIRDSIPDDEYSAVEGYEHAADSISSLVFRAISTSRKPLDIATLGAMKPQYGKEDKEFITLLNRYIEHCGKLVADGIITQDDAVKFLEPTNASISQSQMTKLAISRDSLMAMRAFAMRQPKETLKKEFYDEVFKTYPRLNPDTAFRMATAKDVNKFRVYDLTDEMVSKLNNIEFFDKALPVWMMGASPEMASQLPHAVMSASIPQMTPEIRDAIQANDMRLVREASLAQKTEVVKTIFTNPATGQHVIRDLQENYMSRLRFARSFGRDNVSALEKDSPPQNRL